MFLRGQSSILVAVTRALPHLALLELEPPPPLTESSGPLWKEKLPPAFGLSQTYRLHQIYDLDFVSFSFLSLPFFILRRAYCLCQFLILCIILFLFTLFPALLPVHT